MRGPARIYYTIFQGQTLIIEEPWPNIENCRGWVNKHISKIQLSFVLAIDHPTIVIALLRSSNCASAETEIWSRFTSPSVEFELKEELRAWRGVSKRGEENFRRPIVAKDSLLVASVLYSRCVPSLARSGFIQVRDETKGQTCAPISFINVSDQRGKKERERENKRRVWTFHTSTTKDAARQFL